jgi:hypothetical protein
MNLPVNIFIVYAREDAAYKDELVKALSPLQNQGWVASWHDGHIQPGQVWDEQIRQNLAAADLVLPLISHDFFASEYIQQVEIRHAFERFEAGGCRVVPVLLRACAWEADERLARLQVLPTGAQPVGSWSNRDEAYQNIATEIRRMIQPKTGSEPAVLTSKKTETGDFWDKMRLPAGLAAAVLAAVLLLTLFTQVSSEEQEKKAFEEALHTGTIPALATFRQDYPDGFRAEAAQRYQEKLQARFDSCVASARALHQGGEVEEAQKAAANAARIHPDDPALKFLLQELGK